MCKVPELENGLVRAKQVVRFLHPLSFPCVSVECLLFGFCAGNSGAIGSAIGFIATGFWEHQPDAWSPYKKSASMFSANRTGCVLVLTHVAQIVQK